MGEQESTKVTVKGEKAREMKAQTKSGHMEETQALHKLKRKI